VYKANDPTSNQTVALKTARLDFPEEQAKEFVELVLAEGEGTRELSSQNLALLYGAGQVEDQFCAAMEYVQGNSIGTMLARHEGFSIWDLLDISRQVCAGLDHAASHGVVHHSMEPDKIMVQWDGLVKLLGYGVSKMSLLEVEREGKAGEILHYMSPEQVRGEKPHGRSNLFTWGAILYEMVTDRKAFDGETADVVRHNILNETPVTPAQINSKIHPAVSELVMKALAKAPEERYQSGREMLDDLEKCKENSSKTTAKKAATQTTSASVPLATKAAAASKFVGAGATKAAATTASAPQPPQEEFQVSQAKSQEATPSASDEIKTSKKAVAAAAGWNGVSSSVAGITIRTTEKQDIGREFISSVVTESVQALEQEQLKMSAAVQEPAVHAPRIAVDPMMAAMESGTQGATRSFSDLDELPPLKEVYVEPAPLEPVEETVYEPAPKTMFRNAEPDKPKIQPREVAQKAIKEIKTVPPKLMLYSVSGAIILMVVIALGILWRLHSQNAEDDTGQVRSSASKPQAQVESASAAAAPAVGQALDTPVDPEPAVQPDVIATPGKRSKRKTSAPAPVAVAIVPGQLSLDSTPEGAQVQIDGRSDPSWVTPFNLSGLAPGAHSVSILKTGYTSETRSVEVSSGSKSFVVVHLAAVAASVAVTSEPAGASVFVDGKDTGRVTPMQINLEKGSHTVLVRKQGYLDESVMADAVPGQTFRVSPTLRALGNVEEIKTVGKFKKLFGGGDSTAGMGAVSIKTQPKGAQVAVNRRILDKPSPVEFMLGPGNYIVDITATGYKPIHKVITVEKGSKVAIDEAMVHE
jgi:serine/threonine protein kinase